jgi:hypothetical protein
MLCDWPPYIIGRPKFKTKIYVVVVIETKIITKLQQVSPDFGWGIFFVDSVWINVEKIIAPEKTGARFIVE